MTGITEQLDLTAQRCAGVCDAAAVCGGLSPVARTGIQAAAVEWSCQIDAIGFKQGDRRSTPCGCTYHRRSMNGTIRKLQLNIQDLRSAGQGW
jgi:hypothetical protein